MHEHTHTHTLWLKFGVATNVSGRVLWCCPRFGSARKWMSQHNWNSFTHESFVYAFFAHSMLVRNTWNHLAAPGVCRTSTHSLPYSSYTLLWKSEHMRAHISHSRPGISSSSSKHSHTYEFIHTQCGHAYCTGKCVEISHAWGCI